jgi:hypothetical protein
MKIVALLVVNLMIISFISGGTLHVGASYPYKLITTAATVAKPGDSIICHDPVIQGGMNIFGLSGTNDNWIYLKAAAGNKVIIQGGTNSIQFSDCAYLHIEGFTIQGQTGNGMNIDDAGTFNTPAHHIRIVRCTFQNINATGNNDLLKLSGLDYFEIFGCSFLNGASGGSGIDMVGCHYGQIHGNNFKNLGSNSIQAKGGSAYIQILRNLFENGGERTLNIGGSTDLQYFRPQNAVTEAQNIQVVANVFYGSQAPIAFVGCRSVSVSNNTILSPTKWVLRILQETVDPSRFLPCGDNEFFNNIVVISANVTVEVNIGPNTASQTFRFSNNLWYKSSNSNWQGPVLPGTITNQRIGDPKFSTSGGYLISSVSPAVKAGLPYPNQVQDILGNLFNVIPSIGAHEADPLLTEVNDIESLNIIYPNPFDHEIQFLFSNALERTILVTDITGKVIKKCCTDKTNFSIPCDELAQGLYIVTICAGRTAMTKKMVKW